MISPLRFVLRRVSPSHNATPTASLFARQQCRIRGSRALGSKDESASKTSETLIYPEPSSTKHHDLASFLQYSALTSLDPSTTTYVGTHFEYTVAAALKNYGFSLQRVGGSSDYGIDLLGTWSTPSSLTPLKVLIQCKALALKIGPHLIRELEGAFAGAPVGWKGRDVIGLLVAQRPATKGIRDSIGRSRWPMGFVSCSRDGSVQQMLWNQRAEEEGLQGLGIGIRYDAEAGGETTLALTWKGKPFGPPGVQES